MAALTYSAPFKYNLRYDCFNYDTRAPGVRIIDSSTNLNATIGTNSKSGTTNPNWRQAIARNQDATSDYSRSWYSGSPCVLSFQGHTIEVNPTTGHSRDEYGYIRFMDHAGLINPSDDAALRDLALASLKRKLRDNVGGFNAVVPVAELREMRGLIRNTAALAGSTLQTLIDIRRTRGRSAYQYAADAWLNFSFGVKPLIADTKAASESIATYLSGMQDRSVRLVGRSRKDWVSGAIFTGVPGVKSFPHTELYSATHTLSYQYVAGLELKLSSANNYGVSDHFGLELGVLPSLFWELTPYSWVVDYFANVGEFLEDRFTTLPGSTKYLSLSKLYKVSIMIKGTHVATPHANLRKSVAFNVCYPGNLDYVSFVRTKLTSLPHIGMHFKTADQVGKNAVNKLLNLASVLVSGGNSRSR